LRKLIHVCVFDQANTIELIIYMRDRRVVSLKTIGVSLRRRALSSASDISKLTKDNTAYAYSPWAPSRCTFDCSFDARPTLVCLSCICRACSSLGVGCVALSFGDLDGRHPSRREKTRLSARSFPPSSCLLLFVSVSWPNAVLFGCALSISACSVRC
jgi:hypothetical protein